MTNPLRLVGGAVAPHDDNYISWYHAFFAWFGGTMLHILKRCDTSVQQARAMMGTLVLVVVSVSAILAGCVWGVVFDSVPVGIGIGILWWITMAVLDRNLLASMNGKAETSRYKTATLLVMRLGIAFVISHLNAQFAQMMIFEPEINAVLLEKKQASLASADTELGRARTGYDSWYNRERARIDAARDASRAARTAFTDEISGKGGSGRPGYAEIAKAKEVGIAREEANLTQQEEVFALAQKSGPEARALKEAEARRAEKQSAIRADTTAGLVDRLEALDKVAAENPLVYWMYGLFLLLEMLAFVVKLLVRTDEYDLRVDRQRAEAALRLRGEDLEDKGRILQLEIDGADLDRQMEESRGGVIAAAADAAVAKLGHIVRVAQATAGAIVGLEGMTLDLKSAGTKPADREDFRARFGGLVRSVRAKFD